MIFSILEDVSRLYSSTTAFYLRDLSFCGFGTEAEGKRVLEKIPPHPRTVIDKILNTVLDTCPCLNGNGDYLLLLEVLMHLIEVLIGTRKIPIHTLTFTTFCLLAL